MDINQIRLKNLQQIIDAQFGSNKRRFSERLGKNPSYVSRWFSKSGKEKRVMKSDTARFIEERCEIQRGWLDTPHPELWRDESDRAAKVKEEGSLYQSDLPTDAQPVDDSNIEILQYNDVGRSMGRGVILSDQPGQITSLSVTAEWIEKNIPAHTGNRNLRIVTGFGDSMRPIFNPGDPLLIDAGITTCNVDGIYFFRIGNEGFIKRLQRIPGQGVRAISQNNVYEAWTITEDMDFEIFGRVLKVWAGTKF